MSWQQASQDRDLWRGVEDEYVEWHRFRHVGLTHSKIWGFIGGDEAAEWHHSVQIMTNCYVDGDACGLPGDERLAMTGWSMEICQIFAAIRNRRLPQHRRPTRS